MGGRAVLRGRGGGSPVLQAWLRDRRLAFDQLLADHAAPKPAPTELTAVEAWDKHRVRQRMPLKMPNHN